MSTRRPCSAAVRRSGGSSRSPTIAILLGLLVGAVLIVISGVIGPEAHVRPDPADHRVRRHARGRPRADPKAIANTLNAATPLIFAGLAVAFGFRAGLFNIGANGQFLIGAFCAAIVGNAIAAAVPARASRSPSSPAPSVVPHGASSRAP